MDDKATASAQTATVPPGHLTRTQVLDRYDHDLPEEMGDGPFEVYPDIDISSAFNTTDTCTVVRAGDIAFCVTCEAHSYLDGYQTTRDEIQRWHCDL